MNYLKSLKVFCKHLKVLYVEDDKLIQNIMVEYLKKFFLEIVTADNGWDGLEHYKKEQFDIIITDIAMPKMNGLDMIEKIRVINQEQIVLITTAYTNSESMIRAIRLNVDGFIVKPFEYDQLNVELFKISQKIAKFTQNEAYKKNLQRMIEQKTSELNSMIHLQKYNYDKTLLSMVEMIEDRDTYTAGHSQRVAHYSKMIAKDMQYSKEDCNRIYQAGILHDIGKIATPDIILLNPHKLNDLEYKLIQEHVNVGYRLLINIPMFENLAEIVYSHHEHHDGSGYPRGLRGNEIDPLARIMVVADAFDAMTTNRIYKGRKSIVVALEELELLQATHFDSKVVQSAKKVLKNVEIDEAITQLPQTEIEEERFAYFYRDTLCNAYNKNYLDLMLVQNSVKLKFLSIITLKKFTYYNQKYGWKAGDVLLKNIAKQLHTNYKESYVFRVFGDDFVLLSKERLEVKKLRKHLKIMLHDELNCEIKNYLVQDIDINKIEYLSNKRD